MILNCDLVVASETAKIALPEVKRGVIAVQGGQWGTFAPLMFFLEHATSASAPWSFSDGAIYCSDSSSCQRGGSSGLFSIIWLLKSW